MIPPKSNVPVTIQTKLSLNHSGTLGENIFLCSRATKTLHLTNRMR